MKFKLRIFNLYKYLTNNRANQRPNIVKIGTYNIVKKRRKQQKELSIELKDMENNVFITGAPNQGENIFLQNILLSFPDIPFFLITRKGDYHFLMERSKNFMLLRPGENFSFNIFNSYGANLFDHSTILFENLNNCNFFYTDPCIFLMVKLSFINVIRRVSKYRNLYSWNDIIIECETYLKEKQEELPMLSQSIPIVKKTITRFSNSKFKCLYFQDNNFDLKSLFTKNVILDLSSIIELGGTENDIIFFLSMLLKYIYDYKMISRYIYEEKEIYHFIVIDNAQFYKNQESENKSEIIKYLEFLSYFFRRRGECLIIISSDPSISMNLLYNNSIVVSFKNDIYNENMYQTLGLDKKNKILLSLLNYGEYLIRISSFPINPFLLKISSIM